MSKGPRAEVRDELRRYEALGLKLIRTTGKHYRAEGPAGKVSLDKTPSDHRWRDNMRRDVAKVLGIPKIELERRMGVKPPKRSGTGPRKRKRDHDGRPKALRTLRVVNGSAGHDEGGQVAEAEEETVEEDERSEVEQLREKYEQTIAERAAERLASFSVAGVPATERLASFSVAVGEMQDGAAQPAGTTDPPTTRLTKAEQARRYLLAELSDGPKPVKALVEANPVHLSILRSQRSKLGIESYRTESGKDGGWHWKLPETPVEPKPRSGDCYVCGEPLPPQKSGHGRPRLLHNECRDERNRLVRYFKSVLPDDLTTLQIVQIGQLIEARQADYETRIKLALEALQPRRDR